MTATKIQPGDDLHLTSLMAPHSLNFVTGADRAALLAYGRDVFAAGLAGAAPAAVAPQGVVAWMHPETLNVISAAHKHDMSTEYGAEKRRKAESYSVALVRAGEPAAAAPALEAPAAPAVPAGFALVPIEPTQQMLDAGRWSGAGSVSIQEEWARKEVWSRMLATVTPPPAAYADDLVALVTELVQALRKATPDNDLAGHALDYLKRNGLQESPLRAADTAPQGQTDAQCVAAWRQKMQDEREGDAVVAMAFGAGRRAAAAPQAPAAPVGTDEVTCVCGSTWERHGHAAWLQPAAAELRRQQAEVESLRAERDEADRRAGAAERSAAAFHEDNQRFEQVRRRMKEQWGVHDNVSFDLVWQQALDAKQALAELEARKPLPLSDEQIDDLHGEANRGFDIGHEEYFKAFRDAERAHGIKET